MQLHIPFSEISEHGMHLACSDGSWLPVELADLIDSLQVDVELRKKSDSRIEVQGKLLAGVRLNCDRCLVEFRFPLEAQLQLIVELPESDRHWHLQDMEIEDGADLDTLQVNEPVVDLADILRQQLYLGLPAKQLCRDDCRGLCSHCGNSLNDQQCSCLEDKASNSPFAVLAAYRNKKGG